MPVQFSNLSSREGPNYIRIERDTFDIEDIEAIESLLLSSLALVAPMSQGMDYILLSSLSVFNKTLARQGGLKIGNTKWPVK